MRYDKEKRGYILTHDEVQDINDNLARIREQYKVLQWQMMFRTTGPGKSRKSN